MDSQIGVRLPTLAPTLFNSALPGLQGGADPVAVFTASPHRFTLLEPDLILSFAHAVILTAKVGNIRNPHNAIKGNVLVIDDACKRSHRQYSFAQSCGF